MDIEIFLTVEGNIRGKVKIEYSGHSGRATPDLIPNSEDKPARVLYCT